MTAAAAALLAALASTPAMAANGIPWTDADAAAALPVFLRGCPGLPPVWASACAEGEHIAPADAAAFFGRAFTPADMGGTGFVTGYHEPVLDGARTRGAPFLHPLYRPHPAAVPLSRAEIAAGALAGRGLEILWLADPVEAFFLHVQGAGRVRLAEGGEVRVGYAGRNAHPYRSLGAHLVAGGHLAGPGLTAMAIKEWLRADPARLSHLDANPAYIFFAERAIAPGDGPVGAMGIPLTPGLSLAVDPAHIPLGAPVWVETATADGPFRRLMIAQDTGSAIRGPQRGDIFFGWDEHAARLAGSQAAAGRLVPLLPRGR